MSPADLPTDKALNIISQIAEFANPILVLSGGEPLYRQDIFQLAEYATSRGIRTALATNGTLVTKDVAEKIKNAGIKRVSISLDGSDATTHDTFRGIPGAFDAAVYGMRNLQQVGVSVQINTTIARHNAHQVARRTRPGATAGRRCAAHVPAGPGGLRRRYRHRADGSSRGIRADAELVLRSVAGRRHRVEGHLRAALFPRDAPAQRRRPTGRPRTSGASDLASARNWPDRHDHAGLDRNLPKPERWTAGRTHRTSGRPSQRHERHDQGLSGRNRRLLHLP